MQSFDASDPLAGRQAQAKRRKTAFKDVVLGVALPFLVYCLVLSAFLCGYNGMPTLIWILVGLCVALALMFLILGRAARNNHFMAIGALCLLSTGLAVGAGLWLNHDVLARYHRLDSAAFLSKVDPTSTVLPTTDVGVFHFVNKTFVDDQRTIGFVAKGDIYCVAPVSLPGAYNMTVEFWATGQNCCEQRSNFDCGTAREGDPMFAVNSEFLSDGDITVFNKALHMAKAVYALQVSPNARMVFFGTPQNLRDDLWNETVFSALVVSMAYLILCLGCGFVVLRILMKAQAQA